MKTNILSQTSSCGSSRLESVRKALPDPRHTLPHLEMPSHQIIPPPTPPPEPDYDAYFHSNSSRLSPTSYHHQLYPHHTSSGGSGASSPSTSSRPRSSASARHAEVTLLVDSDDDSHPHPFGLLPHHSTPRRSFSHRHHAPPTSTPASSVASSSHLTTSSTGSSSFSSAISLATILEVFQHNINQSQAWALIFQTVQSLSHLLSDCEQQQNTITECSSYLSSVSGDGLIELVELKSTADLQLDAVSGAVHPSTWSTTRGHLKKVPIKGPASVNLVVAHFAGIIYKALTFGITEDSETKQSSSQIPERKILETNLDSETDEDDEDDDQEIVLESDLEQLLITMIASKDDEVAELTCTSASAVDEGIVDIDDEDRLLSALSRSIIPQVVERCVEHFERLWKELLGAGVATSNGDLKTTNATSGSESCPILMMLYENRNHQDVIINAEVYYRSILEQMLDEFGKLKQLLKQLCEVRDDVTDGGSSSGGHRRQLRNLNETPNTESLKVWAQTWIKVMSELRFGGVHLKHTNREEVDPRMKPVPPTPASAVQPFNALMEQIRGMSRDQLRPSSRSNSSRYLQHSKSLPLLDYRLTINREVIQEQKKSLKPASRRAIPEKPPEEPSLHERLMREVKAGRKLSSVTPEVKPNIAELFWKEKAEIQKRRVAQSKSFPRIKSAFYLTQPPVMAVDRFFESDESDQFTMDYDNDLLTDSTSSLCRCSSVNSNHAHTRGGRGQVEEAAMVTPPKADVGSSFLRRFRSLSVHKLSKHGPGKRKNQAADDSFNTSLPRTPEHHASTPYVSNAIQVSSSHPAKERRYTKKKSRGQLFPEDSLLSTSYPSPPSALAHSHSSIPPQWMTKPTATGYRPISFPSASSLVSATTTTTPRSCQRHNPRGSNPSFVHSFQSPCTCPSGLSILSPSPLGSTTSINHQMTLPQPPPPPPSLFTQNAYRRSYIKKTPPVFDRLAFGSMRRSNSVMFSGSSTKERANSGSSTASKASKWSIGNLFAKLVPSAFAASSNNNNNYTSPSKMKRE